MDYGSTEVTSLERVRFMPAQYSKLPCQGVCCAVYNYNKILTDAELEEFKETYLYADAAGRLLEG